MKVAYVLPYLQKPSGWRSHAQSFLAAIRAHVEPALYVSATDEPAARDLFPDLPIFTLPVTQAEPLSSPRGLAGLNASYWAVRQGRFPDADLVHSMESYPTGLVGVWLAARLRRPHCLTTHGTYAVFWHTYPLDRWVYRQVLRRTSLICPVSHGTARMLKKYFGNSLRRARVRPILNGNDFYKSVPRSEAIQHRFPEVPTLLSVGAVKSRKGHDISLQAFGRLKAHLPNAQYFIAGQYQENQYFRHLQGLIAEQGIQDVHFLGTISQEELHRRYQQSSLFVLTPREDRLHFEGFGLVYLEAGAYGLPVVATRSGGVPDAVKDGITGLLVDPEDVAGVSQAMLRLLTDHALAVRLGQGNRQWAETLTWESYAREQVRAYQDLLESTRARTGTHPAKTRP